jgi:hypothetical protein
MTHSLRQCASSYRLQGVPGGHGGRLVHPLRRPVRLARVEPS